MAAFNDHAKFGPSGEVLEIEAYVIRFCEMIQVAWVEL